MKSPILSQLRLLSIALDYCVYGGLLLKFKSGKFVLKDSNWVKIGKAIQAACHAQASFHLSSVNEWRPNV